VTDQGELVLVDGRVDDGEGVGAGGALEIFEIVDGDARARGGAEHRGVFERRWGLSEGRDAGWKGEEQGGGEGDAIHCYKTHRLSFCILSEWVARGAIRGAKMRFLRDFCIGTRLWHSNRRA